MDQFVPDVCGLLSSPDRSPLALHRRQPSPSAGEVKSPARAQDGEAHRSSQSPCTTPGILGTRPSPSASESDDDGDDRLLVLAKRRKLNYETPNYTPSPRDSPINLSQDDCSPHEKSAQLDGVPSQFASSTDTSGVNTPALSPSTSITSFQSLAGQKGGANFRGRYKNDELWPAIKGDYQFLMDEEIIETCKSTESDLSWESADDVTNNATIVSFNEFLQQYKELTDWLTHIQSVTQRQSSSLSERYLNQTYHEEMLQRSPRRKLFNDYAKQLMRRYPDRKDEIQLRLQHLNKQWEALENAISPHGGYMDEKTMLRDLEQDLDGLNKWLHEVEEHLQPLALHPDWTTGQLQNQLQEHKVLQGDLQAHAKTVSAILKLCERLYGAEDSASNKRLQSSNLERRWHGILLQALEWQCRLEEAIKNGIKKRPVIDCPSSPESDDNQSVYTSYTSDQSTICHLNSTRDLNDEEAESDNSNFDVIPFSESEYEKIAIDTDIQTDGNLTDAEDRGLRSTSVTIPQRERQTGERGDGAEHGGTDSALGRSVSDHSINTDQKAAVYHCSIRLSHDKFRQALTKAVASRETLTMRSAQEPTDAPMGSPVRAAHKMLSLRLENNDFGYSSESHSNEEPESQRHGEVNGNVIQCQSSSSSTNPESIQNANLRASAIRPTENTWRHSMTSAYDTSSNCSDANNSAEDPEHGVHHRRLHPHHRDRVIQNSLLDELPRDDKVSALLSSPNQNFYQMTTIETDSEATSTAERQVVAEEARSGAATDADSELSRSLELPYDSTPIRYFTDSKQGNVCGRTSAKNRLDALFEKIEPLETPVGSLESPAQVVPASGCPSDGDQSMDEDLTRHVSDSGESNALFEMEGLNRFSDAEHQAGSEYGSRLRFHCDGTDAGDCLGKLLHQASLLAEESFRAPRTVGSLGTDNSCVKKSGNKCTEDAKSSVLSQSLTSTEGSVHNAHSTCEASSEGTSETSESDEEFSSTSSSSEAEDPPYEGSFEETLKGVDDLLAASQSSRSLARRTVGTSAGRALLPRQKRGSSRLLSASFFGGLENLQYSVSEGAIDSLKADHSRQKLRRTMSELPFCGPVPRQSTPRRVHRRRLRRGHSRDSASDLAASPLKLAYSRSLPTSRVHSSRSHSRSLSPASIHVVEGPFTISRNAVNAAVASNGPGEHMVPSAKIGTETDDDAVQQSLTSAAEFSENAWDNLHHIYSCISSDPGEEKLDATELQKDWDFQNNANSDPLAQPGDDEKVFTSMAPSGDKPKSRTKEKRLNSSKLSTTQSYIDDSDSDLEDIHHLIEESSKAIKFTKNTLKKFRKDNMETGIFIDPSEYVGPLETCKEHIVCLEEIRNVLLAKTGPEMDLAEVQEISDMITEWEALWHLAGERQKQSKYLAEIYEELVNIKSCLQAVTEELDKSHFSSINELQRSIKLLQEIKMDLSHHYQQNIPKLVESLTDFENLYPDLKMARFDEEIALIQCRLEASVDKVTQRASELQNTLLSWYDFNETQRELDYLLARERCHLSCLEGTEQIITKLFSLEDLNCTIHDLQALDREMSLYERKLEALRAAGREVIKVHGGREVGQIVDDLEELFSLLRTRCRSMAGKIQKRLEKVDKQTQATFAMESAIDARLSMIAERDSLMIKSGSMSLLWRLMKIALPVHIAIVISFCLLCLYDPAYCESVSGFNLVFSPHLSYVDGPPPM